MKYDNKIAELENRLTNAEGKLQDSNAMVEQLRAQVQWFGPDKENQILQDILQIEAIWDVLYKRKMVTLAEIRDYNDTYSHKLSAILHLMIDKKICTAKEFQCHILAGHHMYRKHGDGQSLTSIDWFNERIAYANELAKMPDPLEALGR